MKKEEEIYKDVGKKVRIILPNNIFYHGTIVSEDSTFLIILDKFGSEVRLNKSQMVSLEVLND